MWYRVTPKGLSLINHVRKCILENRKLPENYPYFANALLTLVWWSKDMTFDYDPCANEYETVTPLMVETLREGGFIEHLVGLEDANKIISKENRKIYQSRFPYLHLGEAEDEE